MSPRPVACPTLDSLRAQREDILRLLQAHGASNARVFGSVARGEATADSDVDLLVDLQPNADIFDLIGLWRELSALLGRNVDIALESELRPTIKPLVLKEAQAL